MQARLETYVLGELGGAGAHRRVPTGADGTEVAPLRAEDRQVEVLLDRQAEKESRFLKGSGQAELHALPRRDERHVLAEELDGSGCGRELTRDDVEERRLPGAVRPEDGAPLAGQDVEIDVPHGLDAAEAPADPPQAEDRLGTFDVRCYCQRLTLRSPTEADRPSRILGSCDRGSAFRR